MMVWASVGLWNGSMVGDDSDGIGAGNGMAWLASRL